MSDDEDAVDAVLRNVYVAEAEDGSEIREISDESASKLVSGHGTKLCLYSSFSSKSKFIASKTRQRHTPFPAIDITATLDMPLSKLTRQAFTLSLCRPLRQCRFYSSKPSEAGESSSAKSSTHSNSEKEEGQNLSEKAETSKSSSPGNKTVAQSDQELFEKLESMSGGGGDAALELENGKPVTMKRGVRKNMFRLI